MTPKQDKRPPPDQPVRHITPARQRLKSASRPFSAAGPPTNEGHHQISPISKAVISLAVIDEKSFTRECITRSLQATDHRFDVAAFASCEDCLRHLENHDLILYHARDGKFKSDETSQNFVIFKKLLKLAPVAILSDTENRDFLIEMFESGARAFIPTDTTTLEQIREIIGLVKVGGIFAPLSILCLHRIKERRGTAGPVSNSAFSRRELAVLDRLKLGKANKIIAHELGLSESTVKLHIGRMMRKLKVTNRTQIVSRAYALATAVAPSIDEI